MRIESPFPTCHKRPFPIHCNVERIPLQIRDAFLTVNLFSLNQVCKGIFFIYFTAMRLCQIPLLLRASQKKFILKERLKLGRCFIPQPPNRVGRAKRCQSTRWNFYFLQEEPQRKVNINFLSLSKIEAGIQKRGN